MCKPSFTSAWQKSMSCNQSIAFLPTLLRISMSKKFLHSLLKDGMDRRKVKWPFWINISQYTTSYWNDTKFLCIISPLFDLKFLILLWLFLWNVIWIGIELMSHSNNIIFETSKITPLNPLNFHLSRHIQWESRILFLSHSIAF